MVKSFLALKAMQDADCMQHQAFTRGQFHLLPYVTSAAMVGWFPHP